MSLKETRDWLIVAFRVLFEIAALVGWMGWMVRIGARPTSRWRHGWAGKIGRHQDNCVFLSIS